MGSYTADRAVVTRFMVDLSLSERAVGVLRDRVLKDARLPWQVTNTMQIEISKNGGRSTIIEIKYAYDRPQDLDVKDFEDVIEAVIRSFEQDIIAARAQATLASLVDEGKD